MAPTEIEVRAELTIFWDAFSPLSLVGVNILYDKGKKLGDLGLTEGQAEGCVNKYNSIILRAPGAGPAVTSQEAIKWLGSSMQALVKSVTKRASP